MASNDMVWGLLFLFQTAFGAMGNSFLLGLYIITFFTGPRLRHIDLLLSHLAFVNDLVLLSKGIPQSMAALGLSDFLGDVGCKLVFYFHRVARGLSLCTTCFLSAFQAITLSPRSSKLADMKARIQKCIIPFCFLCWTFHLLTYSFLLLTIRGPTRMKNITDRDNLIYCSAPLGVSFNVARYVFIFSLLDVLCVGIMLTTSGHMVFFLYRHHQKIQYIHGNSVTSSSSPETRATQTILLLVSMFLCFYSLNSILTLCMRLGKIMSWLVQINFFLAACFPTCSPFVLILSDSQICKNSLTLLDRIKLPIKKILKKI